MASTPYTYYRCPCASECTYLKGDPVSADSDEEEKDFDPRAPRSNFSLYQLEQLFYCDTCQQIRCPKCVLEEIVCWFCPNCLFEVASSAVKSEGTRCTRSCFECPCCQAPLSVTIPETQSASSLLSAEPAPAGPYALTCSYCAWTSEEIGIVFAKPTNLHSQLSKVRNGGERINFRTLKDRDLEGDRHGSINQIGSGEEEGSYANADAPLEMRFANLLSFYQDEMADASAGDMLNIGASSFGSPSSLSRLMGLYAGGGLSSIKPKSRPKAIREAATSSEGLIPINFLPNSTAEKIETLSRTGWNATTSRTQRTAQPNSVRFVSDLRPVPYLLRAKRSKRCSTCREGLTRPEPKISSSRYKLRLVASKHIPSMKMTSFPIAIAGGDSSIQSPRKTIELTPRIPTQFILTITNPIYHPIRITLATPRITSGSTRSLVTLLCPEFEVGANVDFIDDALAPNSRPGSSREAKSTIAEAGKVWAKGSNWADVVVEVVPGVVNEGSEGTIGEDEDILEIPVFIRVEWEGVEEGNGEKIKRELAYWCVLGVGRISGG